MTENALDTADKDDETESLVGIHQNWNSGDEWPGHEYKEIPLPTDRPTPQWRADERRAWLLKKLEKYGTWANVPMDQTDVADDFDVTQQSISQDLKELRKYIRFHAGDKAVSMTEMVAQKAVTDLVDEEPFKALQAQLDFNEFLFELGRLERAPDKKQVQSVNVEADASDLTGEEQDHFADLADMIEQGQNSGADDVIDVESEEVDGDE